MCKLDEEGAGSRTYRLSAEWTFILLLQPGVNATGVVGVGAAEMSNFQGQSLPECGLLQAYATAGGGIVFGIGYLCL